MQGATKEEKQGTLGSFLLDDMPARDDFIVLDRSTLERAATCPFQAAAIEQGRVNNNFLITAAGQECHEAISQTIREWIETEGAHEYPSDLASTLEQNLHGTRPDVQPAAIAGLRASIYELSRFIWKINPGNILRFDGGEDLGRSGQLAVDIEPHYRVTAEIDLLYASESPELLREIDWKSGWKVYSVSDVVNSFQFNLHAMLVFENYPSVNGLELRVWDTRVNRQTFSVTFHRAKMGAFRVRLLSAIQAYETEVRGPNPATWPAVEKCCQCPAASLCPVSGETILQIATDPVGSVRKLAALRAKADAWEALLQAQVDFQGHDIVDGDIAFGRNKPVSRRGTAGIYTPSREETSDGQAE